MRKITDQSAISILITVGFIFLKVIADWSVMCGWKRMGKKIGAIRYGAISNDDVIE